MHEYRHWYNAGAEASFITLTYTDEEIARIVREHNCDTLVLRDLQLFMKRLRKQTGAGVRFYGVGEYGSRTNRPHYHVLLFNRGFADKKFYKNSDSGEPLYHSLSLDSLWGHGRTVVGGVSFASCSYVARYIVDKMTGDMADDWYMGRKPEFSVKSNRPGIGKAFLDRFGEQLYRDDCTVVDGREMSLPRYYDTKYFELDPDALERLKKERRKRAMLSTAERPSDNNRRRAIETFELRKLAVYARKAV